MTTNDRRRRQWLFGHRCRVQCAKQMEWRWTCVFERATSIKIHNNMIAFVWLALNFWHIYDESAARMQCAVNIPSSRSNSSTHSDLLINSDCICIVRVPSEKRFILSTFFRPSTGNWTFISCNETQPPTTTKKMKERKSRVYEDEQRQW